VLHVQERKTTRPNPTFIM